MKNALLDFVLQAAAIEDIQTVRVTELSQSLYKVDIAFMITETPTNEIIKVEDEKASGNMEKIYVAASRTASTLPTCFRRPNLIKQLSSSENEILAAGWALGAPDLMILCLSDERSFTFHPSLSLMGGIFLKHWRSKDKSLLANGSRAGTLKPVSLPTGNVHLVYR